jgi:hypothetical protein
VTSDNQARQALRALAQAARARLALLKHVKLLKIAMAEERGDADVSDAEVVERVRRFLAGQDDRAAAPPDPAGQASSPGSRPRR